MAAGTCRTRSPWTSCSPGWTRRPRRTAAIVGAHDLADVGQPGERWGGEDPATLERVLFHLLQEYARHLGHLDIVSELAGGPVGE